MPAPNPYGPPRKAKAFRHRDVDDLRKHSGRGVTRWEARRSGRPVRVKPCTPEYLAMFTQVMDSFAIFALEQLMIVIMMQLSPGETTAEERDRRKMQLKKKLRPMEIQINRVISQELFRNRLIKKQFQDNTKASIRTVHSLIRCSGGVGLIIVAFKLMIERLNTGNNNIQPAIGGPDTAWFKQACKHGDIIKPGHHKAVDELRANPGMSHAGTWVIPLQAAMLEDSMLDQIWKLMASGSKNRSAEHQTQSHESSTQSAYKGDVNTVLDIGEKKQCAARLIWDTFELDQLDISKQSLVPQNNNGDGITDQASFLAELFDVFVSKRDDLAHTKKLVYSVWIASDGQAKNEESVL